MAHFSKILIIYHSRADRAAKFQREKEEREQERVVKQEAKSAAKQEEEVQKQAVKRYDIHGDVLFFLNC